MMWGNNTVVGEPEANVQTELLSASVLISFFVFNFFFPPTQSSYFYCYKPSETQPCQTNEWLERFPEIVGAMSVEEMES